MSPILNSAAAGWGQRWVAGGEHGRVPSWASPVVLTVASSSPVVLAVASSACSHCLEDTAAAGRRNSSWEIALTWAWLHAHGRVVSFLA